MKTTARRNRDREDESLTVPERGAFAIACEITAARGGEALGLLTGLRTCTTVWCMAKSEVYSWRVAPETKAALEHVARRERSSIGRLLERLVREWLAARGRDTDGDEAEQARLHAAAARTLGTIRGGSAFRSEQARALVRRRLAQRRAC
jgi:hypothetical protein